MNARDRQQLYAQEVGDEALRRQLRAAAAKCPDCLRPVRWVWTNGRKLPVDYDPHEAGNIVVDDHDRAEIYREAPAVIRAGATLHFSHRATCPNAGELRRTA